MVANAITLIRIFLTFSCLVMFGENIYIDIAAIVIIKIIFILDAVDGYVARRFNNTSTFGSVFDIVADRIIENVFWIYFAVNHIIHFWMPIAVLTRGLLTDAIRGFALIDAKTPFEMITSKWAHALISSRISRSLSGVSKMCAFLALATLHVIKSSEIHIQNFEIIQTATSILATTAVVICLIRGVPVIIAGKKYIKSALRLSQ